METRLVINEQEAAAVWEFLHSNSHATMWQSADWQNYRDAFGNTCKLYATWENGQISAAGLVIISTTAGGLSTWELPRGPIWLRNEACINLIAAITADAKKNGCIQIFLSPLQELPRIDSLHYKASKRLVFPEATFTIDLTNSDEELLANMKPKGRYNIKVAQKNEVKIYASHDAQTFANLHSSTSDRNAFKTPQTATYEHFLRCLPNSFLLLASIPEHSEPIAGLIGNIHKHTGTYYYGASNHTYRNAMAPYALQWAAMQHCKAHGCTTYDLFGIAPANQPQHAWAGVTNFKEKFGGQYTEHPQEQTIVLLPFVQAALRLKRRLFK